MTSLRKFAKRTLVLLNILLGILFLLACCNAFLHPDGWWFIALLAFVFPLHLIALLNFLLFWLFVAPRFALVSAICVVVGWQNIHAFLDSAWPAMILHERIQPLRVTWNVRRGMNSVRKSGSSGHRLPMLALVEKQNADILCFQEFYEPLDSTKSNIRYIRNHLGYPYSFFS
jgi:hypothetical protein